MKHIIRKAIPVCIYICIGMCIPLLLSNNKVGDKEMPESKVAALAVVPEVPAEVRFADETIKLNRSDLRERMDREITAFTYSHQLTLLMIKRANRYFPIVEPILKECGVPTTSSISWSSKATLIPWPVQVQAPQACGNSCRRQGASMASR